MATTDAFTTSDDEGFVPEKEYSYHELTQPKLTRGNTLPGHSLRNLSPEETLIFAVDQGDSDTVAQLMYSGVRTDTACNGVYPLHRAALKGHVEIVRLLLMSGASPNITNENGSTPLLEAASQGKTEIIQLLIRSGADPNYRNPSDGNLALHEASWRGYSHSLNILSMFGADVNAANNQKFTPLHFASQNGHNQSTRLLLYAGCNPNARNIYGDTALHTAARYGHAGIVRILISAGIRVNEPNRNWDTALHIAAALKRRKVTKLLMEGGADLGMKNLEGYTPIAIATVKNHEEILSIMCGGNNHSYYPMQQSVYMPGFPSNMPLSNSFCHVPQHVNMPNNYNKKTSIAQLPQRHVGNNVLASRPSFLQKDQDCQKTVDFTIDSVSQVHHDDSNQKKPRKRSFFSIFRKKKNKDHTRDSSSSPPPPTNQNSSHITTPILSPADPNPNFKSHQSQYNSRRPEAGKPGNGHHVPGFLNHYNAYSGSQYYKDLAGNIKEQKRAPPPPYRQNISAYGNNPQGAGLPPAPYRQKQTGPIGFVPTNTNCNCANLAHNQALGLSVGPCLEHGYREYHGPITRSPLIPSAQPMSRSQIPMYAVSKADQPIRRPSPERSILPKNLGSFNQMNELSNLPENAPITSMFPAAEQPGRLFKSRSDESLNMSEHKQRMREEKMRQIALREFRTFHLASRESPVRGRRAERESAEVLTGNRGSSFAVDKSQENLDMLASQSPARVIRVDVAQKMRNNQNSSREMLSSGKLEDDSCRLSPDGQIDAHGEPQSASHTTGGVVVTSPCRSTDNPVKPSVNSLYSINVNSATIASQLQKSKYSPGKLFPISSPANHPSHTRPHHTKTSSIPIDPQINEMNQSYHRSDRDIFSMGTDV